MPHDLPQQLLGPHLLLEHPGREIRVAMQLASYLALQFLMYFFLSLCCLIEKKRLVSALPRSSLLPRQTLSHIEFQSKRYLVSNRGGPSAYRPRPFVLDHSLP